MGRERLAVILLIAAIVIALSASAVPGVAETDTRITQNLRATDFPFAFYLRQVHSKIHARWEGQGRAGGQPQVVFEIVRDGTIRMLAIEKSSGNPLYDQAALTAITEVAPFPPLPHEFPKPFLRIHVGFDDAGARR